MLVSQGWAFPGQACLIAVQKRLPEVCPELTPEASRQLKTKAQKQEPYTAVVGSARIELIFTRNWLG